MYFQRSLSLQCIMCRDISGNVQNSWFQKRHRHKQHHEKPITVSRGFAVIPIFSSVHKGQMSNIWYDRNISIPNLSFLNLNVYQDVSVRKHLKQRLSKWRSIYSALLSTENKSTCNLLLNQQQTMYECRLRYRYNEHAGLGRQIWRNPGHGGAGPLCLLSKSQC